MPRLLRRERLLVGVSRARQVANARPELVSREALVRAVVLRLRSVDDQRTSVRRQRVSVRVRRRIERTVLPPPRVHRRRIPVRLARQLHRLVDLVHPISRPRRASPAAPAAEAAPASPLVSTPPRLLSLSSRPSTSRGPVFFFLLCCSHFLPFQSLVLLLCFGRSAHAHARTSHLRPLYFLVCSFPAIDRLL